MKNKLDWRIFLILAFAVLISSILAMPYITSTIGDIILEEDEFNPILQVLTIFVLGSFSALVGLLLGRSLGLGLPWLEGFLNGNFDRAGFVQLIKKSIFIGVGLGIGITIVDILFFHPFSPQLQQLTVPAPWQGFLASFYGGIIEEVLSRLFFATLIIWVLKIIFSRNKKEAPQNYYWIGIIMAALFFAVSHLPALELSIGLTPLTVFRPLLLNAIPGTIFGWLFWKYGLESAIISHFSADIVLHVILFPIILGT